MPSYVPLIICGTVLLIIVLLVLSQYANEREAMKRQGLAHNLGLSYSENQFSGLYDGRIISVTVDEDSDAMFPGIIEVELKKPVTNTFLIITRTLLPRKSTVFRPLPGKYHIESSLETDFAERVFAAPEQSDLLEEGSKLFMRSLSLSRSRLTFEFTTFPISLMKRNIDFAQKIAAAVENTPE
jgi:hypothetical protein